MSIEFSSSNLFQNPSEDSYLKLLPYDLRKAFLLPIVQNLSNTTVKESSLEKISNTYLNLITRGKYYQNQCAKLKNAEKTADVDAAISALKCGALFANRSVKPYNCYLDEKNLKSTYIRFLETLCFPEHDDTLESEKKDDFFNFLVAQIDPSNEKENKTFIVNLLIQAVLYESRQDPRITSYKKLLEKLIKIPAFRNLIDNHMQEVSVFHPAAERLNKYLDDFRKTTT